MLRLLAIVALSLPFLVGCGQNTEYKTTEVGSFVDVLKSNGVEGTMEIATLDNEDIDYVATYVISAFTSTRILSFFKCRDQASAEHNLKESLKNPKFSGQARNGTIILAATFYPPDEGAVKQIRELFLAHDFTK
ncbi:MAG: hypothetical protein GY703_05925 [Gammaproteobacteria bacterium]|nr:hypothetical protein [Gammaproteobacteria bacterium]